MPLINTSSKDEMLSQFVGYDHSEMAEASFGDVFDASLGHVIDEEISISHMLNREGWTERRERIGQLIRSGEIGDVDKYRTNHGRNRVIDYDAIAKDLGRDDIKTDAQLNHERNETLRMRREYYEDVVSRGAGTSQFLGAMNAYMLDPINILTVGIAAPATTARATASIGRAMLATRNTAIIEGSAELGIQAMVYQHKQDIDSPYSASDALANIAMAATGAGILGGVTDGLSGWLKQVLKRADELPENAETATAKAYLQRQQETLTGAPKIDTEKVKEEILSRIERELNEELDQLRNEKDVFFHGTRQKFEEFDPSKIGDSTPGMEFGDEGVFFHSSPDDAGFYTLKEDNDYNIRPGDSPRLIKSKINTKDSLVIKTDGNETNYFDRNHSSINMSLDEEGKDIAIIKGSDGELVFVRDLELVKQVQSIEIENPENVLSFSELFESDRISKIKEDLNTISKGGIPKSMEKVFADEVHARQVDSDVEYLKEMDRRSSQYAVASKEQSTYERLTRPDEVEPPAPPATASQRERDILRAQGLDEVYDQEVAKFQQLETKTLEIDGEAIDAEAMIKQFDDEIQGLDDVLRCAYGGAS